MNIFAVNLSTIFTEVPFLERFKKAKESGFSFVECQFPYDVPIEAIKTELNKHELSLVLINFPAGNWANGERGLAIFPDRKDEFQASVAKGIEYARALGVTKLHCLAGVLDGERNRCSARGVFLENLKYAASEMVQYDLTLLIEPINPYDMPGYFLTNITDAIRILEELNMDNVKLQFDFYHMQKLQGNLITTFQQNIHQIEHVQIADVPGRQQPGTGEINYKKVLQAIKDYGYKGFIGFEYVPSGKSEDSFSWMNKRFE